MPSADNENMDLVFRVDSVRQRKCEPCFCVNSGDNKTKILVKLLRFLVKHYTLTSQHV